MSRTGPAIFGHATCVSKRTDGRGGEWSFALLALLAFLPSSLPLDTPTRPPDMAEIIDPQQADQAQSLQEATTAVASGSSRPTAHAQRYDRQLRLWASSGQASLESSSVLLIGATHLGAQSLKNLILPGIGSFTVLDGQMVGEYDVGNNFFLEAESSYGEPRAQEVARCLAELNPSVKGRAVCDVRVRCVTL